MLWALIYLLRLGLRFGIAEYGVCECLCLFVLNVCGGWVVLAGFRLFIDVCVDTVFGLVQHGKLCVWVGFTL